MEMVVYLQDKYMEMVVHFQDKHREMVGMTPPGQTHGDVCAPSG